MQRFGERRRGLDVRQMGGVELDVARRGCARRGRGRRRAASQSCVPAMTSVGARIAASRVALVHVAHRGAARDVAVGAACPRASPHARDRVPDRARNAGVNQRSITAPAIAAMPPAARRRCACSSARRCRFAPRCCTARAGRCAPALDAEPHADHPAHRQPAEVHALDAETSSSADDVAAELLDRVGPGRRPDGRGRACRSAARDSARQRRHLRRPTSKVGAERIRQHEHRRVVRAVDPVVKAPSARSAKAIVRLPAGLASACAEHAVDERVRLSDVIARVEQPVEIARASRCALTRPSAVERRAGPGFVALARCTLLDTARARRACRAAAPSAIGTASAMIRPCVISRLARMRAASISRPSTTLDTVRARRR